jgi:putative ABC transport system permease protein
MSYAIEPGSLFVGYALARSLGLKKGDGVDFLGRRFRVASCLAERGTEEDSSVFAHLADAQALLGLEGRINEIQALDCVCLDGGKDSLEILRSELSTALPDAQVIQIKPIAGAREKQRQMIEDYLALALPFLMAVAAGWVGVLALANARERWREIGILRALGHSSGRISALFFGKALALGILGALVGFAAGSWLALLYGPQAFKLTGSTVPPQYDILPWALAVAPLVATLATVLPALVAVTQDPAAALWQE